MKHLQSKFYLCLFFCLSQSIYAAQITPFADENKNLWLRLEGGLDTGTAQLFNSYIEEAKIKNLRFYGVTLISNGGLLNEGKAIAKLVRDNGIITYVPKNGLCASSCFWIFAAGVNRYAGAKARIGVHSVGNTNYGEDSNTKSSTVDMIRAYAALGVPDDIVGATVKTPPNDIHYLTHNEINNMVNNPASPEEYTNYLISTNQSLQTEKLIQNPLPSEESKNHARELNEQGLNLLNQRRYNEAIVTFEEAMKYYNLDAEILGNLGYAYFKVNNYQAAQDNITASLKINEIRSVSWGNLGEVVAYQGYLKWAEECFRNYILYSKNKKSAMNHLNNLAKSSNIYLSTAAKSAMQ